MKELILSIYDEGYGGASTCRVENNDYMWVDLGKEVIVNLAYYLRYKTLNDPAKDSYCKVLLEGYDRIIVCDNGHIEIYEREENEINLLKEEK